MSSCEVTTSKKHKQKQLKDIAEVPNKKSLEILESHAFVQGKFGILFFCHHFLGGKCTLLGTIPSQPSLLSRWFSFSPGWICDPFPGGNTFPHFLLVANCPLRKTNVKLHLPSPQVRIRFIICDGLGLIRGGPNTQSPMNFKGETGCNKYRNISCHYAPVLSTLDINTSRSICMCIYIYYIYMYKWTSLHIVQNHISFCWKLP